MRSLPCDYVRQLSDNGQTTCQTKSVHCVSLDAHLPTPSGGERQNALSPVVRAVRQYIRQQLFSDTPTAVVSPPSQIQSARGQQLGFWIRLRARVLDSMSDSRSDAKSDASTDSKSTAVPSMTLFHRVW